MILVRVLRSARNLPKWSRGMVTQPYDSFAELEERFPRQTVDLGNGEVLSFVDCEPCQAKHTLLLIPGYACDSKFMSFTLAQYDAFQDHRIIGVDPRGYGGSTLASENWSHEENARDMKLFLDKLGVEKTMVMGYSTGGGAASWLALNYPNRISAVWMLSALPLNGMRTALMTTAGKTTGEVVTTKEEAISYTDLFMTPGIHSPNVQKFRYVVGTTCMNAQTVPPESDRGFQLLHEAALQHRSRASALYANNTFNITPIQTPISPPTSVLKQLTCPMIVLHGSNDALIKTRQVRAVTELALVERWAPKGKLFYYEMSNCGHLFMYDNPNEFQRTYRRALEKHVLKTTQTVAIPFPKL